MSLPLKTEFLGDRGALFSFGLKLSAFTVLTLGIYRFWMKTRLRRWYWSAIRPGGHPLEYTGDALEKLLGFLIAVVFLSFYIGVFNLILMFFSFTLLNDNFAAYAISFVAVIPILFFAQYRARRYILARTRWRGIRFGLQPAAWRYSGVAICMWVLTICSVGALWPLMTFQLEKFRTNRTWFGSARLTQGGKWYRLTAPALPALFGLWATLALGTYGAIEEDPAVIAGLLLTVATDRNWVGVLQSFGLSLPDVSQADRRSGGIAVFTSHAPGVGDLPAGRVCNQRHSKCGYCGRGDCLGQRAFCVRDRGNHG